MAAHVRIYSTPRMQLPGQKSNLGSGQRVEVPYCSVLESVCVCVSVCLSVCSMMWCGHVYCC